MRKKKTKKHPLAVTIYASFMRNVIGGKRRETCEC
jgi:hypothetical protein